MAEQPGVATTEQPGLSSEERVASNVAEAQILSLAGSFEEDAIHEAFRKISKVMHPDVASGDAASFRHLKLGLDQAIARARSQVGLISKALASDEPHVMLPTRTALGQVSSGRVGVDAPREHWVCVAPADHSLAQVLRPTYLKVKAQAKDQPGGSKYGTRDPIRPGDTILITHEEGKFRVLLEVVEVLSDVGAVNFKILEARDLTLLPVVAYDWEGAVVADDGPGRGWVVKVHGVSSNLSWPLRAAAEKWLGDKQALARVGKTSSPKE